MGREGFLMEVALSRSVNDEKKPCENLGEECSDGGKSLCKGTKAGQSQWASGRRRGCKAGRGQIMEGLETWVRNLDLFRRQGEIQARQWPVLI